MFQSVCAWEQICVCNIAQLTQRQSFLYYPHLHRLGPPVSHPAAWNVWCITLLESPGYPHTQTAFLWIQPTPLSRGRQREGPHPWGRIIQIPKKRKKKHKSGTELMSTLSDHIPHILYLSEGRDTKTAEIFNCCMHCCWSRWIPSCLPYFCLLMVLHALSAAAIIWPNSHYDQLYSGAIRAISLGRIRFWY